MCIRDRVQTEGNHFVYQDGSKYLPFGTTIYALSHQPEELIDQTIETLKEVPFNKVRHCVFPKHYDYNHNEPQLYPFEKKEDGSWDVHHPCFAYWDHLEAVSYTHLDRGIRKRRTSGGIDGTAAGDRI